LDHFPSELTLYFPHPETADSNGLVAIGGDLSPQRLLLAYQYGIFPWYNEGDPILWWSPDPRCILYPNELHVSGSMKKQIKKNLFHVTFDKAFRSVVLKCRTTERKGQYGTWITPMMVEAYCHLHEMGYAHSIEVWDQQVLAGGIYGISLGKIFFGESMFSLKSNASKFGLIFLARHLLNRNFVLIDCQQNTPHARSLGATLIPRKKFLAHLRQNWAFRDSEGDWVI